MALQRIELDVELDDGSEHHLNILNPSLVAWDRTRAMRKWPTVEEAPMVWQTFLAWHHMKAAGLVDCTHEEFEQGRCVGISSESMQPKAAGGGEDGDADEGAEEGAEEGPVVDPTPPALGLASAST